MAYVEKPLELSKLKELLQECAVWMYKNGLLKVTISEKCIYDYSSKTITTKDCDIIVLTAYEYKILEFLLERRNKVATFEEISYVLYSDRVNKKSLSSLVYKINKKLSASIIKNVKDIGYIINKDE